MIRVRFAPSPTGPLHIGGVRTALYNYLFARKNNGTFILRIEDTDQERYIDGAEFNIIKSLLWLSLMPDNVKGHSIHDDYRQRKRADIFKEHVEKLISTGNAYYAWDTTEDLELKRSKDPNFKYDSSVREQMDTSLTMSANEINKRISSDEPYVIRFKIPKGEKITFSDRIRGEITFSSDEMDDKVLLKADGYPTYHLANVVDDHLMKITHVIRGEEWLSSTPLHVLLYRAFGWEKPEFAHLPLILKPTGKGKLSKRDSKNLNIPVIPIQWEDLLSFEEEGFLPEAVLNFLLLLGWNDESDKEIYTLKEMIEIFSLDNVQKKGARYDYDKAKWINSEHIKRENGNLKEEIEQKLNTKYDLNKLAELMKPRIQLLKDLDEELRVFNERPENYDISRIEKKMEEDVIHCMQKINNDLKDHNPWTASDIKDKTFSIMKAKGIKAGHLLPVLRTALTGGMTGPDLFATIDILGEKETRERINSFLSYIKSLAHAKENA